MTPSPETSVACRICGSEADMAGIYAFGLQPVAGYLEPDETAARQAPRFPLTIARCKRCGLLQQGHDAARRVLIERVYSHYHSTYAASKSVSTYVETFVTRAAEIAGARPGDHVIEIGSNDGSLLRLLARQGLRPVGFEPSGNLNDLARSADAQIVEAYFGQASAEQYRQAFPAARLVLSRHTLEHAFEPLDFVRGICAAMSPEGVAIVEVPYLPLQAAFNHFEAMTFQHVCFYTLSSLCALFEKAGLTIIDNTFVEMDGGSIVVFARHAGARHSPRVDAVRASEQTSGWLGGEGDGETFARIDRCRDEARRGLTAFSRQGLRVLAYGAGSKGQSLLNMLALDGSIVSAVRDDTPGAGGQWVAGAAIPVVSGDDAHAQHPDVVLLSATTHTRELMARAPEPQALYVATVPYWRVVPQTVI